MFSTFGPRLNTVFRSRWRALWWSAGVLLTAYCAVPSQHQDTSSNDPGAQVAAAANILGNATPAPQKPVNPWAKTPSTDR